MSFLYGLVPFLLVISIIVTIHELGHYGVARLFNTRIETFSVGFGKVLWKRTDKHGVVWAISAIPLGGYVKFAGDENIASMMPHPEELDAARASITEREGAEAVNGYFHFKPLWQRFLIILAGPMANFILAIFVFSSLSLIFGEVTIQPKIVEIEQSSPAEKAGLKVGDVITAIDGKPTRTMDDVILNVSLRADTTVRIDIIRNDTPQFVEATLARAILDTGDPNQKIKGGKLGIKMGGDPVVKRLNPFEALTSGTRNTWKVLDTNLTYISRIFKGKEDGSQMSGILGMTKAAGDIAEGVANSGGNIWQKMVMTFVYYLNMIAFISVGVGFINLVPIPPLDGGHLLFYGYQSITGKTVHAAVQNVVFRVAIVLVFGLMLFAFWNDFNNTGLASFFKGLFS